MSAAPRHPNSRSHRSRSHQPPRAISAPPAPPTSPVTAGNTSSYASQLHAAILATRESILTESQNADASRNAALGGLDVARRTFADARYGLRNAVATRAVTSFLDQKIGDGNETGLNTVALSQNSNTEAQTAASTMSDAATSIKAAAAAVETVIVDVNGIAGVTNANDRKDPINQAAHEAVIAVAKLGKSVDELKCLALIANVEAASPQTAPVVQAVQANQMSISNLLATFDATLKATTSAVTDAQTARTNDLNQLFSQSEAFTVAASNDAALAAAIKAMDLVSNEGLTATVLNTPSPISADVEAAAATSDEKKQSKAGKEKGAKLQVQNVENIGTQVVAGFKASWTFSSEVAKETVAISCFAVPFAEAPSFDFESAVMAELAGNCATYYGPETNGKRSLLPATGHVVIQKDSNGDGIVFGEQYRIFALRTPDVEFLPQTATQFSFPTPPITSTIVLSFPGAPKIYPAAETGDNRAIEPLPHNAFVAVFPAAAPNESVDTHRLFFAPVEVIEREKDAELVVADALNAAAFTEVSADNTVERLSLDASKALAHAIWLQNYGEVPSGGKPASKVPESFYTWLKDATAGIGPFYVVYFSPFATTEGWVKKDKYFIGRYTDMYGDLFDLEERAYEAYALAVGKENDDRDGQVAQNVLSAPSVQFPRNIHVAPLPTNAETHPSKE